MFLYENGKIKVYIKKEYIWKVVIGEVNIYDIIDLKFYNENFFEVCVSRMFEYDFYFKDKNVF